MRCQNVTTKEVVLDQDHYAQSLWTIAHSKLRCREGEDEAGAELHDLYRSPFGSSCLLGAHQDQHRGLRVRAAAAAPRTAD